MFSNIYRSFVEKINKILCLAFDLWREIIITLTLFVLKITFQILSIPFIPRPVQELDPRLEVERP